MSDKPKNILIVEDDAVQQIIMERLVNQLGHNVLGKVTEGKQAIKSALRLDAVDLILMDIRLRDDIDGIEAMNKIREESNVKVVYITGNSDPKNIERAKATNFIDFITKPVNEVRLKKAFTKAFN